MKIFFFHRKNLIWCGGLLILIVLLFVLLKAF